MLKQMEGSQAVAAAVAMCRPGVICAYPITPQTHIVEALSAMVKRGDLAAEFLNVESEFAALSVAIGASATGARAYTATASQGLLYMSEAVYNAAGLGLPIVMTVANRAIGAPINIWNDHSDAMSQRDAGWLQLYAETNQEALDLHIQAFRIAERLSVPVMVCMDGFLLTHASERVDLPAPAQVDGFLPRYDPRQVLDPAEPVSIGAMVGPEAFTEVRYLAYERMQQALAVIPAVAAEFDAEFGRTSGGLVRPYLTDDADTVVVGLGSVLGTVKDAVDELRADGLRVGVLGITTFRPFPARAVRQALKPANRHLVILERALAPGTGGIVTADLRLALGGRRPPHISTVVAGLGGRAITAKSLRALLTKAAAGELEPFSFLDLDTGLVERELARMRAARRSGPSPENILRDLGVVASRIG
jgi:pyruvate ferredoxin oxidoreductase alpha subunit